MTEHGTTDRNQVQPQLDHATVPWERTFNAILDLIAITERERMEAELQRLNEHLEMKVAERTEELTQTIDRLYEELTRRVAAESELRKHGQMLEERAEQLQHLTLELSQAEDRERKRLAEILHDDLQQLLAAAKFHLSLLHGRLPSAGEPQKLAATTKDLLQQAIDRSRSLSHELSPPTLSHPDLYETFEWLAQQVQTKYGLMVQLEAFDRLELHSEPLRAVLYKAAQEMLFNVIKHAGVREARLRLRRCQGRIYLSVADGGQGFDMQATGKAGLGLLNIRERAKLLGGRVKVRSAQGKGCIFILMIPDPGPMRAETDQEMVGNEEAEKVRRAEGRTILSPSDLLPFSPSQLPSAGPSHVPILSRSSLPVPATLRVLLVDDHKIVRQGLEAMLAEAPDVEVIGQASNGREAIDLAHRLGPDVIVMDVAMPVMAGDEATRQIKQRLPHTRIIALSMFDDARVADRMRRAGAAAYLLKTAPAEELLAAIRGRETAIQES